MNLTADPRDDYNHRWRPATADPDPTPTPSADLYVYGWADQTYAPSGGQVSFTS